MQSVQPNLNRLARFQVLRQLIFAETGRQSARMRLMWVAPFHALVLTWLIACGQPAVRSIIFGCAFVAAFSLFTFQAMRKGARVALPCFMVGLTSYLAVIGTTGGLSSPLLVTGLPMLMAAAIVLDSPRQRTVFFGFTIVSVLAFAFLSRTALGELVPPLAPVASWSSAEYVALTAAAFVFSTVSIAYFGRHVSTTYERIAFELATRREEVCTEGEGRTKALEGMAARLAHEVKNPLAAIKGLSTHVARSATDPKIAERLSIVAAEADRLQAIVDGFLSFSRGLDELNVRPTKPYEIARELTVLLEARAAEAGVVLEVAGDADASLEADGLKLRQALLNLVLNAIQASPYGARVTLRVDRPCPFERVGKIAVIDHGSGMAKEVLERIRKPYFTTREGGSGLGVAVARGLIEQHGGTLEFDSTPGRGTTATVRLPITPLRQGEAPLPKVACGPAECTRALMAAAKKEGKAVEEAGAEKAPAVAKV